MHLRFSQFPQSEKFIECVIASLMNPNHVQSGFSWHSHNLDAIIMENITKHTSLHYTASIVTRIGYLKNSLTEQGITFSSLKIRRTVLSAALIVNLLLQHIFLSL
jgi:hypothetical protein